MDQEDRPGVPSNDYTDKSYALSGKIMLSAFVILFFVVIVMVCFHLYARWYLLRARRSNVRRVRNRPSHLVFYVDPTNPNTTHVTLPSRGLDATVLKSLPVFVYTAETHPYSIECAVCLSEFEENETGRILPKCNHSFHTECIDMWFHSHSTCPLCRSPVEQVPENPVQDGASSGIVETGTGSSLCSTCQHEEGASTSSFVGRRKPVELAGVTIEVPRRGGSFEDESGTESPASQAFRSPMSRMLSFKRILSRGKAGVSTSSGNVASCNGELDLERGREETHQNEG